MKIRLPLFALICSLALMPALRAEDAAPKKMADKDEPQTELGEKMEANGRAFRKLRRQINDATKNEDSLKQVAIMKEATQAALTLEPAKKAEIPPADQAKFVDDFHAGIKEMLARLDKLEAALKAGDNVAAAKLVDELNAGQKEGHKAFKKADKKKS